MSSARGGVFSRWAERKRLSREGRAAEPGEPLREDAAAPAPEAAASDHALARSGGTALSPEEIAALPDPETLQLGDSVAAFMRAGVPDEIRKRALRRLWRLNPTLANVDGLVEYGEDYARPGKLGEAVKTAYAVGRGFRPAEPSPQEAAPASEGETADVGGAVGETAEGELAPDPEGTAPAESASAPGSADGGERERPEADALTMTSAVELAPGRNQPLDDLAGETDVEGSPDAISHEPQVAAPRPSPRVRSPQRMRFVPRG